MLKNIVNFLAQRTNSKIEDLELEPKFMIQNQFSPTNPNKNSPKSNGSPEINWYI